MQLNNLSIIVAAKEEADNLKEILPILKEKSDDIIVVDGHSKDNTESVCKNLNVKFCLDNKQGKETLSV